MQIGDRLRALRLRNGLTLTALADAAGVSKSMVSRIERNESAPTTTTLQKIADALGVRLADLFAAPGAVDPAGSPDRPETAAVTVDRPLGAPGPSNADGTPVVTVVRRDQRKRLILPWGASYEMLAPDLQRRIEFIFITYPVNGGSGDLYTHEGEECGFVVEGRFRGIVGDAEFLLEPGDSICYASTIPHRWENAGDVEARAVWAVTPPSFLIGKISE